jgi:hypothetical protein
LVSAGGFLAVTYLKCRENTGEIDYLLDPEFVDEDVRNAFREAVRSAAVQLGYNEDWVNYPMGIL